MNTTEGSTIRESALTLAARIVRAFRKGEARALSPNIATIEGLDLATIARMAWALPNRRFAERHGLPAFTYGERFGSYWLTSPDAPDLRVLIDVRTLRAVIGI